jgi:hypothetical protein
MCFLILSLTLKPKGNVFFNKYDAVLPKEELSIPMACVVEPVGYNCTFCDGTPTLGCQNQLTFPQMLKRSSFYLFISGLQLLTLLCLCTMLNIQILF